MYNSVVFGKFMRLHSHHDCLIPEHLFTPKRKLLTSSHSLPATVPAPGNQSCAFYSVVGMAALLAAVVSTGNTGGHNTCDRLSCHSCTSGWTSRGRAWWCHPQMKHQVQGGLFEYCSPRDCSHPPAVCPQASDTAGRAGCPPSGGFTFNILHGVTGLCREGDGLGGQGLHRDRISASAGEAAAASLKRKSKSFLIFLLLLVL